jgi:hypothetical protein
MFKFVHPVDRWSGKATLDSEGFRTRGEAEARAKQLMRLGETYTIEDFDGDCPRCLDAWNLKSAQERFLDVCLVHPQEAKPKNCRRLGAWIRGASFESPRSKELLLSTY